jgi:flavorubredoxin
MKALIPFVASAETKKLAEIVKEELEKKNYSVKLSEVIKHKKKTKAKQVRLKSGLTDWKPFDLIVLGFPVIGISSSHLMNDYLKQCTNISGKQAAIFIACIGLHGNALKKASSIISFHGGKVKDSVIISSFLGLNEKKINQAREFVRNL